MVSPSQAGTILPLQDHGKAGSSDNCRLCRRDGLPGLLRLEGNAVFFGVLLRIGARRAVDYKRIAAVERTPANAGHTVRDRDAGQGKAYAGNCGVLP
ncbi:MAG: hypothetical protein IIY70_04200 [Oscillospiraceae bacterium]|nr:hypothetical protein [Oscillospiraceae bacterium]